MNNNFFGLMQAVSVLKDVYEIKTGVRHILYMAYKGEIELCVSESDAESHQMYVLAKDLEIIDEKIQIPRKVNILNTNIGNDSVLSPLMSQEIVDELFFAYCFYFSALVCTDESEATDEENGNYGDFYDQLIKLPTTLVLKAINKDGEKVDVVRCMAGKDGIYPSKDSLEAEIHSVSISLSELSKIEIIIRGDTDREPKVVIGKPETAMIWIVWKMRSLGRTKKERGDNTMLTEELMGKGYSSPEKLVIKGLKLFEKKYKT